MTVKHSIDATELLTRYTPLVRETVQGVLQEPRAKLIGGYVDQDDLEQVGRLALLEAWESNEPDRGDFASYARTVILRRVRDELRKATRARGLPEHRARCEQDFYRSTGRLPTDDELVERYGWDAGQLARSLPPKVQHDEPVSVVEAAPDRSDGRLFAELVDGLGTSEKGVVTLRLHDGHTFPEIARMHGRSVKWARGTFKRAIAKLRERSDREGDLEQIRLDRGRHSPAFDQKGQPVPTVTRQL